MEAPYIIPRCIHVEKTDTMRDPLSSLPCFGPQRLTAIQHLDSPVSHRISNQQPTIDSPKYETCSAAILLALIFYVPVFQSRDRQTKQGSLGLGLPGVRWY